MATTLHHPTLPTTVSVPDSAVDAWVEQGWRKTAPTTKKVDQKASKTS